MSALNPQQTSTETHHRNLSSAKWKVCAEAKSLAETLLGSLGLSERLDALPREMSGGEQRRVTLGACACPQSQTDCSR